MNPKVDWYFEKAGKWQNETELLRTIALDKEGVGYELKEELKWGCPCYAHEKHNVVLIHVFKEYCAMLFFKGALLNDPGNILIQQTENVQSARQLRFTDISEILEKETLIKSYINAAVEVEKAGLKVPLKKTSEYKVPEEFQRKLNEMPALKNAFESLTPGRQRAYLFHFSQAKQSSTREARVEKYMPQILAGKGIDD